MTRKAKAKPKAGKETRAISDAVDDRHLSHPHAEPVDPAGRAVFDDTTGPADGADKPCPEPPTAEGDPDAIGFTVLTGEYAEPDDDDGMGVGAVVEDECDPPAAGSAASATVSSRPARVAIATAATPLVASADAGSGSAVLPGGKVPGTVGRDDDIREGFGLVFWD